MPTISCVNFGREFFGGPKTLENQADDFVDKIRRRNALRNSPTIF